MLPKFLGQPFHCCLNFSDGHSHRGRACSDSHFTSSKISRTSILITAPHDFAANEIAHPGEDPMEAEGKPSALNQRHTGNSKVHNTHTPSDSMHSV
eukprot:5364700-Amphidinium_carterae.1